MFPLQSVLYTADGSFYLIYSHDPLVPITRHLLVSTCCGIVLDIFYTFPDPPYPSPLCFLLWESDSDGLYQWVHCHLAFYWLWLLQRLAEGYLAILCESTLTLIHAL